MFAYLEYFFYSLLSFVIFPFTVFNFVILNTNILPKVKPFVVVSGSMEPAIPTGSIIYTIKKKEYQNGDVITFLDGKGNTSHRIVGSTTVGGERYYLTKGDQNDFKDEDLVSENNVLGKITATIPFVGRAILFLRNISHL